MITIRARLKQNVTTENAWETIFVLAIQTKIAKNLTMKICVTVNLHVLTIIVYLTNQRSSPVSKNRVGAFGYNATKKPANAKKNLYLTELFVLITTNVPPVMSVKAVNVNRAKK